jgi:hypothetical protein
MSIAQLRATTRNVHGSLLKHGWDTTLSTLPRFYILTDRPDGKTNRYEASPIPLPQAVWDSSKHGPSAVIAGLYPKRVIWHQTYRGVMFSMEGWSLMPTNLDDATEVERMLAIGEARQVYAQPDRVSIRSTTAIGRDDEAVFIFQQQGEPGAIIQDSEAHDYEITRMSQASVPTALRRLNDRIMSMMD